MQSADGLPRIHLCPVLGRLWALGRDDSGGLGSEQPPGPRPESLSREQLGEKG